MSHEQARRFRDDQIETGGARGRRSSIHSCLSKGRATTIALTQERLDRRAVIACADRRDWHRLVAVERHGAVRYTTAPVTRGAVTRTVTATGTVNPVLTIIVGATFPA